MLHPKVAIIGRPNVGKSTLLNRLSGRRIALVHDRPGVTRDRRIVDTKFYGISYSFVDTPGLFDPGTDKVPLPIQEGMREQAMKALNDADIICFMIDGRQGTTPYDEVLADHIRLINKPVIVLVNKSEGKNGIQGLSDAAALGLTDHIIAISAEHGEGMVDFAESLEFYVQKLTLKTHDDALHEEDDDDENTETRKKPISLTIMGRPNAGKSTLFNTLIQEDRQLTGDLPGLTRDAISHPFDYKGIPFTLIDTAGLRRQSKIIDQVEKLAVVDAKKALQYTEIVVLLIDGSLPIENHIEKQDLTLCQKILDEGRALVLAVNKWDLVKDKKAFLNHLQNELTYKLSQASGIPVVPISAVNNKNCDALLDACLELYDKWNKRVPTSKLNQWFDFAIEAHSPPIVKGQRIKLKYITQIKTRPPSFVVFGTKSADIPDSYQRFLVNRLRDDFDLKGVPIRLHFKSPQNPYTK
ncbi:MAG: ribosome biogenesis GTPase Der [Proteobacteria bacterium]|nr:ribosome biogenesis GTPase Der [Pseudomonadota bacterium]